MLNRRHRAEHFSRKFGPQVRGEEEDVDLEVVDMDDLEDVPFEFVLPRDRVVDFAEEDDDISLSDTPGSDSQEGPAPSFRLAPVARHLAVCGGDMAASIEDEGRHSIHVGHQGAGPIRHSVFWRAPPRREPGGPSVATISWLGRGEETSAPAAAGPGSLRIFG